jgi:hypothetical protein
MSSPTPLFTTTPLHMRLNSPPRGSQSYIGAQTEYGQERWTETGTSGSAVTSRNKKDKTPMTTPCLSPMTEREDKDRDQEVTSDEVGLTPFGSASPSKSRSTLTEGLRSLGTDHDREGLRGGLVGDNDEAGKEVAEEGTSGGQMSLLTLMLQDQEKKRRNDRPGSSGSRTLAGTGSSEGLLSRQESLSRESGSRDETPESQIYDIGTLEDPVRIEREMGDQTPRPILITAQSQLTEPLATSRQHAQQPQQHQRYPSPATSPTRRPVGSSILRNPSGKFMRVYSSGTEGGVELNSTVSGDREGMDDGRPTSPVGIPHHERTLAIPQPQVPPPPHPPAYARKSSLTFAVVPPSPDMRVGKDAEGKSISILPGASFGSGVAGERREAGAIRKVMADQIIIEDEDEDEDDGKGDDEDEDEDQLLGNGNGRGECDEDADEDAEGEIDEQEEEEDHDNDDEDTDEDEGINDPTDSDPADSPDHIAFSSRRHFEDREIANQGNDLDRTSFSEQGDIACSMSSTEEDEDEEEDEPDEQSDEDATDDDIDLNLNGTASGYEEDSEAGTSTDDDVEEDHIKRPGFRLGAIKTFGQSPRPTKFRSRDAPSDRATEPADGVKETRFTSPRGRRGLYQVRRGKLVVEERKTG